MNRESASRGTSMEDLLGAIAFIVFLIIYGIYKLLAKLFTSVTKGDDMEFEKNGKPYEELNEKPNKEPSTDYSEGQTYSVGDEIRYLRSYNIVRMVKYVPLHYYCETTKGNSMTFFPYNGWRSGWVDEP